MAGLTPARLLLGVLNLVLIVLPAAVGWAWFATRGDGPAVACLGVILAAILMTYRLIGHRTKGHRVNWGNEGIIAAVVAFAVLPAALAYALLIHRSSIAYAIVCAALVSQFCWWGVVSLRHAVARRNQTSSTSSALSAHPMGVI